MKRALLFLVLAASLCFNLQAQLPAERQAAEIEQAQLDPLDSESVKARVRHAAAIQEIILALLDDHNFEAVFPEIEKMLALELEGELEGLLIDTIWYDVGELRRSRQFALAHKVVDAALIRATAAESKFRLLILKGQTFKDQGRNREAVRVFREAQQIQK